MFRKKEYKKEIEGLVKEYNDFYKELTSQVKRGSIQPEDAFETLNDKYQSTTEHIEILQRENDDKYRLNVFRDLTPDNMKIMIANKLVRDIFLGGRGKSLFVDDENVIRDMNEKDYRNVEVELAGSSWAKYGSLLSGNTFEARNLMTLKALIRSQYILIRQNNQIINLLKEPRS